MLGGGHRDKKMECTTSPMVLRSTDFLKQLTRPVMERTTSPMVLARTTFLLILITRQSEERTIPSVLQWRAYFLFPITLLMDRIVLLFLCNSLPDNLLFPAHCSPICPAHTTHNAFISANRRIIAPPAKRRH